MQRELSETQEKLDAIQSENSTLKANLSELQKKMHLLLEEKEQLIHEKEQMQTAQPESDKEEQPLPQPENEKVSATQPPRKGRRATASFFGYTGSLSGNESTAGRKYLALSIYSNHFRNKRLSVYLRITYAAIKSRVVHLGSRREKEVVLSKVNHLIP